MFKGKTNETTMGLYKLFYPAIIYLLRVNNRNAQKKVCNIFKVNNKTPEWRCSCIFTVKFEYISHLFLVYLLLTLNK